MTAHDRLARIARSVLHERFVSVEDQADAIAAAVITEGLRPQWGASDPGLDDPFNEPAGWYESSDDCDAEAEARSLRDSFGGELFIRYATGWERVA